MSGLNLRLLNFGVENPLRGAKPGELSFHIDEDLSSDMKSILEKVIEEHSEPQGEGLLEFLYALATRKMTLKRDHLSQLIDRILEIDDQMVKILGTYIRDILLKESTTLQQRIAQLEKENQALKEKVY